MTNLLVGTFQEDIGIVDRGVPGLQHMIASGVVPTDQIAPRPQKQTVDGGTDKGPRLACIRRGRRGILFGKAIDVCGPIKVVRPPRCETPPISASVLAPVPDRALL